MRTDAGAPEFLAIVEAAVAVADRSDTWTYARLLALLSQSLVYTPQAARRIAIAQEALALAESASDPALLAHVAPAVVSAIWAPGSAPMRSAVAARALTAAESSGDPRLEFAVRVVAYNVAVESGDAAVAAHSLARIRATARAVGEPRLRWIAGLYDTFDAMMAGRLDEAETLAVVQPGARDRHRGPRRVHAVRGPVLRHRQLCGQARGASFARRAGRQGEPRYCTLRARLRDHLRGRRAPGHGTQGPPGWRGQPFR